MFAGLDATAQVGLADEQDAQGRERVHLRVGQHAQSLELGDVQEVSLVDDEDHVAALLGELDVQRAFDLGDEGGVVEPGRLAQGGGDRAVQAAGADHGIGQVDDAVAGGVQAVGGSTDGHRFS